MKNKKSSLVKKIMASIVCLIIGAAFGIAFEIENAMNCECKSFPAILIFFTVMGLALGLTIDLFRGISRRRRNAVIESNKMLEMLPIEAVEYIRLVVKYIRYRKRVRVDVQAELAGHFEDAIRDCKDDEQRRAAVKKLIEEFGDAKMLAVLTRRAKKRCRPWWKKAIIKSFQTAGVIILLFILYVGWFLSGKPRIDTDYLAKYNEMVRPAADDSLNAAPYYEKAAGLLVEDDKETRELLWKNFKDVNDVDVEKISKWLADNNDVFKLIKQGTQKPYYWRISEYNPKHPGRLSAIWMPQASGYRRICFGLRWSAYIKTGGGNYAGAFDDIKMGYLLGRHNKGGKALMENYIGIALEVVSVYALRELLDDFDIPSEYLTSWQNEFEKITANEDFTMLDLSSSRLLMYDEIQRCFTKSRFGKEHLYLPELMQLLDTYGDEPSFERFVNYLFKDVKTDDFWEMGVITTQVLMTHPNKEQTRQQVDGFCSFLEEVAKKTPAQIKKEKIDIDKKIIEYYAKNIMLNILGPNFKNVIQQHYRAKVGIESVVPTIAILRYKADKGVCPDGLQTLVDEGYLKTIPMDPFSDEPIKYKKAGDDFVLYCVGLNMVDDGGVMGKVDAETAQRGRGARMWADDGDTIFWPVGK